MINYIILGVAVVAILISSIMLFCAYRKKVQVHIEQNDYEHSYQTLLDSISKLQQQEDVLTNNYQLKKDEFLSNLELMEQNHRNSMESLAQEKTNLEKTVAQEQEEFDLLRQDLNAQIQSLRNTLTAGIELQKRQKAEQDKIENLKVHISEDNISDIQKLEELKKTFSNPTIISKLIWTNYYQKEVTQLCNRVLPSKTVIGIYKITNLVTNEYYIGQSRDIAQRWKNHCKCGCGIDTPATNKLYNNMLKYGLYNFTFELVEECPLELLNEKEALWIDMLQSDKIGLNSKKGNK